MRILLIRLRLVGDVVFTTPAIRAVRRAFPTAHLAYLVEDGAAAVLHGNPHLDDLIVVPRRGGWRRVVDDLSLCVRLRRAGIPIAVITTGDVCTGRRSRKVRTTVQTDVYHPFQSTYLAEVWDGDRWNEVVRILGTDPDVRPPASIAKDWEKIEFVDRMTDELVRRAEAVLS